jgi:hypothetical protein
MEQVQNYITQMSISYGVPPETDISFLANCTQLKILTIDLQNIKSLEPLKYLDSLEILSIDSSYSQTIDCSIFRNLKNLKRLSLGIYIIENIEVLKYLDNLENLYIQFSYPEIIDLSVLMKLKNLKRLEVYNKKFENIEALKHLDNLEELILRSNYPEIIDGSIFTNLKNLKCLELYDNKLENAKVFFELPNLEEVGSHNYYKGKNYDMRVFLFELGNYNILQNRANVRTGPTRNSDVIAILSLHDEIEILENSWIAEEINGVWAYWYKIKFGSIIGYTFGGNIALEKLVTDIDKNGINDYFYWRFSTGRRGAGLGTFDPLSDVIIYINNQRIGTSALTILERNFEWCTFEEGDDYVLVGLIFWGKHDYEYMHIFKVIDDGKIEYMKEWREIDYW